jgi:predicted Fe-S protein YdhL (DUF1289 family)
MSKSVCPLCSGSDGFPQTMADQKIVGNLWATGSYTVETQYVFCRDCRVQLEPLITWQEFNSQKQKQVIENQVAALSPADRAVHDAQQNLKETRAKRSMSWQWFIARLILGLPVGILIWLFFFEYFLTAIQFGVLWTIVFYLPSLLMFAKKLKRMNAREKELLESLSASKS